MTDVVVVGGGFAGLAAGAALAAAGASVTVLEGRPHLGGRARSFHDDATDTIVDNGQHAMMGCYAETLAFLDRIAASGKLRRQHALRVEMHDPRRGRGVLACPRLPGPLHMLSAVCRYRLLTPADRLRALAGGSRILAWHRRRDARLAGLTVEGLLDAVGQPAAVRRALWHPIAIATVNETPDRAAAGPFVEVLARAFFGRRADSDFVLPAGGPLRALYRRCPVVHRGARRTCRDTRAGDRARHAGGSAGGGATRRRPPARNTRLRRRRAAARAGGAPPRRPPDARTAGGARRLRDLADRLDAPLVRPPRARRAVRRPARLDDALAVRPHGPDGRAGRRRRHVRQCGHQRRSRGCGVAA